MKKYYISKNELQYLEGKEIEANNEEEAEAKYIELMEAGEINVANSDIIETTIKLIK
jgi:hypothetical protein